MDKNYELRDLDLDAEIPISIHELAQVFNTTANMLETICREKNIGMLTIDGHIFVYNSKVDSDIEALSSHVKNTHLEEDVLNFIKENQPTTFVRIANALAVTREVVMRVCVDITHKDINLWEDEVDGFDYLYYFDGDYSKW